MDILFSKPVWGMNLGLWEKLKLHRDLFNIISLQGYLRKPYTYAFQTLLCASQPGAQNTDAEALPQTFVHQNLQGWTQESTFLIQFLSIPSKQSV